VTSFLKFMFDSPLSTPNKKYAGGAVVGRVKLSWYLLGTRSSGQMGEWRYSSTHF
jgi:hypothetical protein